MRKTFSVVTVVLLMLALAAQAVSAAPLVPVSAQGKAAAAQNDWEIGEITFAPSVDEDGVPIDPDVMFVEGTETIYAIFDFTGLVADDVLTGIWYQDDEEALTQEFTVGEIYDSDDIPDEGTIWFFADFTEAAAATYTFELYVNGDFAQTGTFLILTPEEMDMPMAGGAGNIIALSQQIPILITIPHPDDPDQTITVPVTLTVDLHIRLGSNPEVIIEVGEATDMGMGDLTEDQITYLMAVSDAMIAYGEALTTLGDLLTEAGDDESLLEDEDWVSTVYEQLDTLVAVGDEVRALEAPEGFEDVQDEMVAAADHFEEAALLIDDGLQELDADLLNQAVEEITAGSEALQNVGDLIGEWQGSMGESSTFGHELMMSIMDNFPTGSF